MQILMEGNNWCTGANVNAYDGDGQVALHWILALVAGSEAEQAIITDMFDAIETALVSCVIYV